MEHVFKIIVFVLTFIDWIYSKELHIKEDLEIKDEDIMDIINVLNRDGDLNTKNERFARHLEAVTESVLEHLLTELKHKYKNRTTSNQTSLMKLFQKMQNQVKKHNHNAMIRNKKNKKHVRRSKKGSFGKRTTTTPDKNSTVKVT